MAKSDNLRKAKDAKYDEFYTRYEDIDDELYYYTNDREDLKIHNQFKDKVVLLNCDDPEWSNFYKYFDQGFTRIGLKKLISTHYEADGSPSYALIKEKVGDNIECRIQKLKGNGDFCSDECIEFLKECDIVCTNPPFSLFRAYIAKIMEYDKKFIVIGNMNAIAYKEVFPLIKDNKIWLGTIFNKSMEFRLGADAEKWKRQDEDGNKYGVVPGITWFTNLDHYQRHEFLDVSDYYYGNEEKYPRYDNYDAIEVGKIDDIPCDYEGIIGLPLTFVGLYNPEQFSIEGYSEAGNKLCKKFYSKMSLTMDGETKMNSKSARYSLMLPVSSDYDGNYYMAENMDGRCKKVYTRIFVKLKNPRPRKEEK